MNIREQRIKLLIAAATNLVASVLVALTVGTFFVSGGEGNMTVKGAVCFVFFTVDSNVLAALGGLAAGIAEIVFLCRKQSGEAFLPKWLYIFKFAGACAVTVTFLTVVAFLGPTIGYASMFSGINFFLHFLCPLMFAETAVLFDPVPKDVKRITLICAGTLPVVIYGAVYYYNVITLGRGNGGWDDFYGFNAGGHWYISMTLMLVAAVLISAGLYALLRLRLKRTAAESAESGNEN